MLSQLKDLNTISVISKGNNGLKRELYHQTRLGAYYNVPIEPDKIFEILSEPDIIKDRKLSGKRVRIKWEEENFQLNLRQRFS